MWQPNLPAERRLRRWLSSGGSLTLRIRRGCAEFRVERLSQRAARPFRDEGPAVGVRAGRLCLVRDVLLYGDDRPLVFGHSITAIENAAGPWRSLRGLGNRPLAEALYNDPGIWRQPLSYRRLGAGHPLYRRVAATVGRLPATLWARRSVFTREGAPLMVTEVFLPAILRLSPD